MTLDEALEYVAFHECNELIEACESANLQHGHIPDWFAVETGDRGVIAYFADKNAALGYRMFLVNQILNTPLEI